ncbi:MAG: methyltransferase domain-containing protein [Nitrospira sp. SB0677_bin_15]|nr:methyltransferase domain-containing protein [Nitrospira sp. SB0661_bin_20]MYG40522.1 methyltransferase domain-containing protein [Nitrospira sp. SB0677_bin_15]MYH03224.1 methyltransferase domain-containing protein [Nitrospira sp. SB0675_bin_23]MYJ21884.1 methyltransferase domain-containing protein [Nitrospira sp. SB0673_bin_12]
MGKEQLYGDNPIAQRKTDQYKREYVHGFVRKWDELIDWEARVKSEGDFFINILKERGVRRVLDVATGTGFHSIRLLKAGFDVTSGDGSPEMLAQAFENAKCAGFIMKTLHADWRWLSRDVHTQYDAVICLGNSLTHLFSEQDRRKALAEFYSVLNHDGVLILDQRNYDGILDNGFTSKHVYYYCGDNVSAEPEYVDEGLARFRYRFPDDSEYHLNMFPLRKDYVRKLMGEVGFQQVKTFADFQETHRVEDPDFYIHVAEKLYKNEERSIKVSVGYSQPVETARSYYNSHDADRFYATVWGGEDIHVGLYERDTDTIFDASRKTVEKMASMVKGLGPATRVVDIGSGYGGSARYLVKHYGCQVGCLNLSETQNTRNRELNAQGKYSLVINVVDGSFEDIPMPDGSTDVVWSQDAILHSGNREKVFEEVNRVLAPGGQFIFTDPMQSDTCPQEALQPILDRIHLDSLGSIPRYKDMLLGLGFKELAIENYTEQLSTHYRRVLEEVLANQWSLVRVCSEDYIERMKSGLQHWIDGGKGGHLTWGILHFQKP